MEGTYEASIASPFRMVCTVVLARNAIALCQRSPAIPCELGHVSFPPYMIPLYTIPHESQIRASSMWVD